MLILECSQGWYGRTDGSVSISLRNFVGERIIKGGNIHPENKAYGENCPFIFKTLITLNSCCCITHLFLVFTRMLQGKNWNLSGWMFPPFIILSPTKLRRDIETLPSVLPYHPCEHSRINILQWILTKLGTYLILKRIWNPIDFRSKVTESNY
jgi:hypothetical protein